jgi:lipopolysaccharide export system permease protein
MLITFTLTGIVWLMQALRFVDFIINRGLSVSDFLYLTLLILPSLLTMILPIALLIAVVFIYNKLSNESELVVMKAAGLSRFELSYAAMIAGGLVMITTYVFTLYLQPTANRQFRDMKEFLRDNYASILLQEEVFNHPVDGMTVFIRERTDTGELKGILVHDNRKASAPITMMAEEGVLVQTPNGPSFKLEKGVRQERADGRVSWLNFDNYNLDLSYYTKQTMTRELDESERYFTDLWRTEGLSDKQRREMHAEAHRRITWPWFAFILSFAAVTAITGGEFNRRGMWKRVSGTALACALIIIGYFTLGNAIVKYPYMTIMLYLYAIGIFLFSLSMLIRNTKLASKVEIRVGHKEELKKIESLA